MFQRVYFAPRQAWIKEFTSIAANPNFVGNVQEVIYDGRLFLPELGNFASYWSAFCSRAMEEFDLYQDHARNSLDDWHSHYAIKAYQNSIWNVDSIGGGRYLERVIGNDCREFYMNVANSLVRYVRHLDRQENILRQGRDFQALCEGLKSFRNISKVSALVDFEHFSNYMPPRNESQDDCTDSHVWYNTRSESEFGLTVPPSRWCRRPQSQDGGEQDQDEHIKWDVRGVQNLFRALSMNCPNLKELHIGSWCYKAPLTIFQLSDTDIEKARTMFRCLTTLQFHPYVTKSDDGVEYLRQRHCLELSLQEAKELRFLSSSRCFLEDDSEGSNAGGDNSALNQQPDFAMLLGQVWSHLTDLTLTGACVTKRDMISLVRVHRVTLRTLRLEEISLLDEATWEDLGLETGKILRLHAVSVYGLVDCTGTFPRWLDPDKRGLAFVRGAMQWALPDVLEIEQDYRYGSVIGRLKAGSS